MGVLIRQRIKAAMLAIASAGDFSILAITMIFLPLRLLGRPDVEKV